MDKLIRSAIIFSLLSISAVALDLEEAISLYKSKGRDINVIQDTLDLYKASYNDYQKARGFGMPLTNTTEYYRTDADNYFTTNTTSVGVRLIDFNLKGTYKLQYDVSSAQYGSLGKGMTDANISLNIMDAFYYNDSSYAVDGARIKYEKALASSSQNERTKIGSLIDLYVATKTLEGKLDIKKRSLIQLQKDREFMATKYSIGTIAKIDIERVELEGKTLEQEIDSLQKQIFSYKLSVCDKLGILPDPYIELSELENIDIDEVLVDDTHLYLTEKDIESSQADAKYSKRSTIPNLYVKGGYDNVNERYYAQAVVSWNPFNFSGAATLNAGTTELYKQNLEIAKTTFEVTKEQEKIEFENAESSLKVAQASSAYWSRLANVKRDMYRSDLISFQEYMRYYNESKDKEIAAEDKRNTFNGLKRKIKLLEQR